MQRLLAGAAVGAIALSLGSAAVVAAGDAFERSASGSAPRAQPIPWAGGTAVPSAAPSCRPVAVTGTLQLERLLEAAFGHAAVVVHAHGPTVRIPTAGVGGVAGDRSGAEADGGTLRPIDASELAVGRPRIACDAGASP